MSWYWTRHTYTILSCSSYADCNLRPHGGLSLLGAECSPEELQGTTSYSALRSQIVLGIQGSLSLFFNLIPAVRSVEEVPLNKSFIHALFGGAGFGRSVQTPRLQWAGLLSSGSAWGSHCGARAPGRVGLSRCCYWAWSLPGIGNLPGLGIKLMSAASQGEFLTPGPPEEAPGRNSLKFLVHG